MATVAKVAVQAATYAIDKVYDYLLPPELAGQVGCRVLVPFGRGNRLSEAVILSLRQEVPDKPLKAVRTLLDEEPILTEKELRLTLWMTRRYFCTFYDALRTVLPTAVWYHYRETWTLVREPEEPTAQEAAVCRLLQDGAMSTDKLRQGDLRHQDHHGLAHPQQLLRQPDIHHRLAAAGNAPQQRDPRFTALYLPQQRVTDPLLPLIQC